MHHKLDTARSTVTRESFFLRTGKIASLCSIISSLALTGTSYGQAAADAPTTEATIPKPPTEEVVQLEQYNVVGIRASAMKAIEVKRNSAQLMEAIVAEDIGKFPDNNVVESLQRVPGIQVTDFGGGQISRVTIRGLDDITTTLNGRNIFTASGLSLSLPDIPTSLLKEVDVKKTRAASDLETGIAGVIDIQTNRPFDFAGGRVGFSAKATYQQQGSKYDPNVSALFSDRWKVGATGKFGALFNVSYMTQTYRNQNTNPGAFVVFQDNTPGVGFAPYERVWPTPNWWQAPLPTGITSTWTPGLDAGLPHGANSTFSQTLTGTRPNATTNPAGAAAYDAYAATNYILSRDAIFQTDGKGKTKRPAANLSLQFAPNENAEYTAEVFYDGFRNQEFRNLLFSLADFWGALSPTPVNDVVLYKDTNIVKSRALVGDVYAFTSGDVSKGKTDSYQYSLGAKWKITPDFKLSSEFVYQHSLYSWMNFFTRGRPNSRIDLSADFNHDNGLPAWSFPNYNITDPSKWVLEHVWDQAGRNQGSAGTLTEDGVLNVNWGFIKRLKFGLRVDDRKAAEAARYNEADPAASTNTLLSAHPELTVVNSGFFDGRAAVPSSWAAVNGDWVADHTDQMRKLYTYGFNNATNTAVDWSMKENFNIDEITIASYLQVDEFKMDIAGHKLSGQFGLRFVDIKTTMEFTDQTTMAVTGGNAGVSKILPSGIVNYEFSKNFIGRLSYGETIRRPAFAALNPLIRYNQDVSGVGYGTASGGNPNLKPTKSKNIDLALEYYFDESSAISLSLFDRKIDGLIVDFRNRVTATKYPTNAPVPSTFILSQPDNASNGVLRGAELGGKYFPKNLPGFLQGFGVEGSYTRLKSSQDIPILNDAGVRTGTRTTEFNAVSRDSYSGTLAYERSRYSGRLSYTWRSAFLHHQEAALFANPLGVYNRAERSLNAQFGIRITDGLAISIEGTNLTNDIQKSYYGNSVGNNNSTLYNFNNWIIGRSFSVSARYSF